MEVRFGLKEPGRHVVDSHADEPETNETMTTPKHRAGRCRPRWRTVVGTAVVSVTCVGTAVAVGAQVLPGGADGQPSGGVSQAIELPAIALADAVPLPDLDRLRRPDVSRSGQRARTARSVTLEPRAVGHRWATARLNVWSGPGERFEHTGLVPVTTKLRVTGQVSGRWAEVLVGERDRVRWVNADFLAKRKPAPPVEETSSGSTAGGTSSSATTSGISTAPCPDGSSVESGLTSSAVAMYRAACAAFPALAVYGGYDNHGEHADGRAIDFMVTDSSLGSALAEWLRVNAGPLGVRDVIWAQRIWTPDQASAGWRYMSDRGSATANHYDHVHAAVF